ncbi:virulence factor SrfB [Rhodovulum sp. DZ06]|uniref:virulence factor SrfB n=1 Tax=Rhodovulum sp. DZ06 TaxID=3425126 RepID=UPI003D34340D
MQRAAPAAWPEEVTLAPNSGIQFMEFGFSLDQAGRKSMEFAERIVGNAGEEDDWRLWPLSGEEEKDAEIPEAGDPTREQNYTINNIRALEPFLRKWTPVPVLRLQEGRGPNGEELFDGGPSTWARIYLLEREVPDEKTGHTHTAILALDTGLDDDDPEEDEPYLAPSMKDAADERRFRLVGAHDDVAWFVCNPVEDEGEVYDQQKWVSEWLQQHFDDFKQAQRPGRPLRPEDYPYKFEHWARYLAMLRLVATAVRPPVMRLLDTVSGDRRYEPVDVDLILDIGNSRTCGILVESFPDERRVDLNNCYALGLRDLGRPELYARRPFESRVEFAQADFGPEHIARRAGRARPAFLWPSMVRVGPEAARMVLGSAGTETVSGLSSPKRYIWDKRPMSQDWRFNGVDTRQTLPTVARSSCRFLNEAGDVIAQVRADVSGKLLKPRQVSETPATRPRFSRSSLYGFMLGELIAQALMQINDVGERLTRKQSELPRRLRNVILTLPSATPLQEQAIMRSRAEGALKLLWSVAGWSGRSLGQTAQPPKIVVDWDEASCTHLVWLYDEIAQKFGGQIDDYFELMGRRRRRPADMPPGVGGAEPSLRVACIDVGGGTTDLMITTFYGEDNREIRPYQNVREGFRTAGDDLVQAVVENIILPQLRDQLAAHGCSHAEELLRELFGGDVGDVHEQTRQKRRQFSLQILTPLALAALGEAETMTGGDNRLVRLIDVVGALPQEAPNDPDLPPPPPQLALSPAVIEYLEDPARMRGTTDWRLADAVFDIAHFAVDRLVRDVFGPPVEAMLELADHLGADALLLSGRPTRLPTVGDMVREAMVVPPHRVLSMHEYKVGGWYPYRDRVSNRIGDPKTTAAVGGMLCRLAESSIVNFKVHIEEIRMRSTARFIGEMERNGQLLDRRIMFSDVDLQARPGADETATVDLRAPMHIGFRQMPHERWPGSPLYRLDFANESARRLPTPLKVEIGRRENEDEAETSAEKLRAETLKEGFDVLTVEDASGTPHKADVVRLSLHTLGVDAEDYWLDTGIFRIG